MMPSSSGTMERSSLRWYQHISVEPTMFLYMFAFQLTSVIEQAFFVRRACMVNHNYSAAICDDLGNFTDIQKEVQITVSNFHQWNNIAGHIFPIIIALFIGSWSDRRGRKLPLLIGLTGKLIYVLAFLMNIRFERWPIEYVIYTASIPSAFTGADITIFAASFAYISDVSSVKNRTLRVTILDICYLITFPIGIALGSYLFTYVFHKSYTKMFAINAFLLAMSIVYSLLNLKWQTSDRQELLCKVPCKRWLGDFFDYTHVRNSIETLTKRRPSKRRTLLWTLLIAMFFYTFQRDERTSTYLYTQKKFHWGTEQFSNFKVFQSTTHILMLFGGVPIMTRLLKWPDTTIAMVGAINFAAARVFFALAAVPEIFYVGAFVSSIGPVGAPILRSMTSKVVPISERGKVFAMLAVCDNAVPLVSGPLYSQVYNLTYGIFPGFFILTACTQIMVFALMLFIHISLHGEPLTGSESDAPRENDSENAVVDSKENTPDRENNPIKNS